MEDLVQKIADGGHGMVSMVAKDAITKGNFAGVIDFLGQQAVKDAPESMKKHFGIDLYNEIVMAYHELPEELKTYTTGKLNDKA